MGELLFCWISSESISKNELVSIFSNAETTTKPKSESVSTERRRKLLCCDAENGLNPTKGESEGLRRQSLGEPDAGKLHVRFDEGRVRRSEGMWLVRHGRET